MTLHVRRALARDGGAAEVERLVWHMPTVAETAKTDWARSFALSIVRQSRRRGWNPSQKQLSVMRDLVNDLFSRDRREEADFDVIE